MDADGPEARDFVAALVRSGAPSLPGAPGLAVPEGAAAGVIEAARRLALAALPGGRWRPEPAPELLALATALVVDEHPSASGWTAADRERVAHWVALLIEHRGEDGVGDLVRELGGH